MANRLWGNIYFKDEYAGRLEEAAGDRIVFTYDISYCESKSPPIARSFPLRTEPYISEQGLHPFFDNLVSEGWLRNAQAKALGINPNNRFALLLGFGFDLAGAVSVIDPKPQTHRNLSHSDGATLSALRGRASLSGIQRKFLAVKEGKHYRPVNPNEISTHIIKLSSGNLAYLLELEYLTTQIARKLLPHDDVISIEISSIPSLKEEGLIIPRFDRTPTKKRIHFEEFNSLLNRSTGDDKYDGHYEDMGQFILNDPNGLPTEADRLFQRILICLLVGNTDAHFKNFAMFHTRDGLRLTPAYDLVASSIYPEYQSIALGISGARDLNLTSLKAKHLLNLGKGFGISPEAAVDGIEMIGKRLPLAFDMLSKSDIGPKKLRDQIMHRTEKRWKNSYALTGKLSLKRQNKDAKANG